MPPRPSSRRAGATDVLLAVFRAAAAMLRFMLDPAWINSPQYRARLEEGRRREQSIDDALRLRYPDADFRTAEFERRARDHGVRFLADMPAHHVAAFLDYLDDPGSVTVSPIQALNIQAYDADGNYNASKTHPVNRAQFQILARFAQSIGWDDEDFSPARMAWTDSDWVAHERAERERLARARELSRTTRRPVTLERTDSYRGLPRTIQYEI